LNTRDRTGSGAPKLTLIAKEVNTGPACHLTYLTGARHSHLDSAGYSLDQKAGSKGEALTPEGVQLFAKEL
jgi:hypothetical protein